MCGIGAARIRVEYTAVGSQARVDLGRRLRGLPALRAGSTIPSGFLSWFVLGLAVASFEPDWLGDVERMLGVGLWAPLSRVYIVTAHWLTPLA